MGYQENLVELNIELAKLIHQIQALAEEDSKAEEPGAGEEEALGTEEEETNSEPEDDESEGEEEDSEDEPDLAGEDSGTDEPNDTQEPDDGTTESLVSAADTIVTETIDRYGNKIEQVRDAKTGRYFSKPSSGKGEYDVGKVKDAYKQAFAEDYGDNLPWPTSLVNKTDAQAGFYQEEVEKEPPTTGGGLDPQPITGDALVEWKINEGAKELNDHGIKWPEVEKGRGTHEVAPLPWPKSEGKYLQGEELIAWKVEKHHGSPKLLDTSDDGVSWPINAVTSKPLHYPIARDEGGNKIPLIGEELTHWKKKNGGHIDRDRAPKPPNMKQFVEKLAVYEDMAGALASVNLEEGDENDPATIASIEFRQHLYDELELKIAQMAISTLGGDLAGIVLNSQLGEFAGNKDLNKERDERVRFHKKIIAKKRKENPAFFAFFSAIVTHGSVNPEESEEDYWDDVTTEMAERAADMSEDWEGLSEIPGKTGQALIAGLGMALASPRAWWISKPEEEKLALKEKINSSISDFKKNTLGKWAEELKDAQEAQSGSAEDRRKKSAETLDKNIGDDKHDFTSYLMDSAERETRKKEAFSKKAQIDTANNDNKPPENFKQVDVKALKGKKKSWGRVTSVDDLKKLMGEVSTSLINTVVGFISQCAAMTELTSQVSKLLGSATKTGVGIQSEAQGRFIAAKTSEARFPHKPLESFLDIDRWEDDTYMCINKMNETSIIPLLLLWDLPEFQDYLKKELARVFPKRV